MIKAQKQKVVKMVYNSAKPYWFWQALPQVSKIITSSLQAWKFTAIISILAQLCGSSMPSIRSYRDCSPLRQGGGQYSSTEPELTQRLKVCYSSKNFSIISAVFLFLTVAEWLFLHFSYRLWYVLHSIKALCTILVNNKKIFPFIAQF